MNTKTKNSRKNWNFHFLNFGRLWDENSWLTPVHRFKFIGTGVNQAFWTLNNQCNMNVSSSIAQNCYGGDIVQKKQFRPYESSYVLFVYEYIELHRLINAHPIKLNTLWGWKMILSLPSACQSLCPKVRLFFILRSKIRSW